jgi:FAD/FMN-containing dehydrogenase
LARSYLFEDLSSEQLAPLAATAATRTLVRGEYTWHVADPAEDATHIAAVRDASAALAPLSLANAYVNFEAETDADRARAAYGPEIYDRLARLKRQYDPTNLFSRNQNVKPAP